MGPFSWQNGSRHRGSSFDLGSFRLIKQGAGEPLVGWFGGHPRGIHAQDWPRCRVCGAPMCHLAQINAGFWLDLGLFKRMSVFICHATGGHCEDWDPYKGANQVLLHREKNEVLYDGPPTVRVYRRLKLSVEPCQQEQAVTEAQESCLDHDKLGGHPVWLQQEPSLKGRDGQEMRLLMQMTTQLVKFDITDGGMAYVFVEEAVGSEPRVYLMWQGR
jgi:hypothetical protein